MIAFAFVVCVEATGVTTRMAGFQSVPIAGLRNTPGIKRAIGAVPWAKLWNFTRRSSALHMIKTPTVAQDRSAVTQQI